MTGYTMDRRRLLTGAAVIGGTALMGHTVRGEDTPIKLGVLTDLSGPYRDTGGPTSVVCVKQAVADFKVMHPSIPVEVLAADHLQKADIASSIARSWIDRDGVDAIIEVNNSGLAMAVNAIVREKNKVQLNSGALSSDLTGKSCSPNFVHWAPDSWMCAHAIAPAMVKRGSTKWFFIAPDYAFGHALQRDAEGFVKATGGSVTGTVFYPFPATADFSSFFLQAQASGADVIGVCAGSGDLQNMFKQGAEFGIGRDAAVKMAGFIVYVTDVHAVGLPIMHGVLAAETFYWDMNDNTRAFTKEVLTALPGNYPQQEHAAAYGATMHYLKCAAALGVAQAKASGLAVVEAMKKTPTDDKLFGSGQIREDGRWTGKVYVFEAKTPAESKNPWDVYKLVETIPADQSFRPIADGGCPFVKA